MGTHRSARVNTGTGQFVCEVLLVRRHGLQTAFQRIALLLQRHDLRFRFGVVNRLRRGRGRNLYASRPEKSITNKNVV